MNQTHQVRRSTDKKTGPNLWFFFGISISLLVLGGMLGYLRPESFRAALTPSISQIIKLVDKTHGQDAWLYTFGDIFFHNVLACLALIFLGFLLGIFPTVMLWTNGVLLGFVIALGELQKGIPAWKLMVFGILPHGVFELPALAWAGALGFANGYALLRVILSLFNQGGQAKSPPRETSFSELRAPRSQSLLSSALIRSFKMLPYILCLLFIAGLVESTVTPHVIRWGIKVH
jgi:stage II sporulation protein M